MRIIANMRDGLGCLFGVLPPPGKIIISLFIGGLELRQTLFPEDRIKKAHLCAQQKNNFQNARLCDAVYDIGESFLQNNNDPVYCSDQEIITKIKSSSNIFKFQMYDCERADAHQFAGNVYEFLSERGANFSECGSGYGGRGLTPETRKNYEAFLACRSSRNSRD